MESKRIDEYFMKAKQVPIALAMTDIKSIVSAKGVTSPPNKSWWNLNNIIIMTTIAVIGSLVALLSTTETQETLYTPKPSEFKQVNYMVFEGSATDETNYWVEEQENKDLAKKAVDTPVFISPIKSKIESNILLSDATPIAKGELVNLTDLEENSSILDIPNIKDPAELFEDETVELSEEVDGESKIVTKSIDANGINTFVLDHKNGEVNIETWDSENIEVTATFTLETEEPEDMQKGLDDFAVNITKDGSRAVAGTNWDELNNCSCNTDKTSPKKGILKLLYFPSKNKAQTDEGEKFEYKKFKITYQVKIPKRLSVDISNKYADINLPSIGGGAEINIFRGNLRANEIGGDLDLIAKYSSVEVGSFQKGNVVFFRSEKSILGNSKRLQLKANYSTVDVGGTEEFDLTAFRTNLTVNGKVEEVESNFKYGDLLFKENVTRATLTAFHAEIEGIDFSKFEVSSSYSKVKARKIDDLNLENAFRNEVKVEEVGVLRGELKYTPVRIQVLRNSIDINAFRSELEIEEVKADFERMTLNTKYTDINLKFSPDAKYDLNAETTYTDFKVPDEIMDISMQNGVNGNANHFTGTFNKGSSKTASKVYVNSFQGNLILN